MTQSHIPLAAIVVSMAIALSACTARRAAGPLEKGIQFFEEENYAEAKGYLETAVRDEPENPAAAYYLGRIAMRAQQFDEAITWLEKAVALDEKNSEYHLRLGYAYVQKLQTVSFFEQGALAPKVKEELEAAVELDPNNVDARMALAGYYLNAPPMAGGSKKKAKEQAEAVKGIDARQGHLFMAQIHMQEKKHDAAEAELLAAKKLEPNDEQLHYQLGLLYQDKKEYGKAFESFETAVAIDPGYMPAMYQIGRTGVFSGENLDRAVECLKMYLRNEPAPGSPTWAHAHWRLGSVYERMGRKDMAKKEYEAALELDPDLEQAKEALKNL